MSGSKGVLIDSVILIDHFKGLAKATDFLASIGDRGLISVITRAEVLSGFDEPFFTQATQLLDAFVLLNLDKAVADLAARLRRTEKWKLPDALQAAFAISHGLWLATRNTRDFLPKKHAFVYVPYR